MNRISFPLIQFVAVLLFSMLPLLSHAGIVVLNGLTHMYDVVPGETYRGTIEVQNTGKNAQPVKLSKHDYSFNYQGEVFYEKPGTLQRSNTGWIDISPSYVVLKPNEKVKLSFEIKVPQDTRMMGTYWSVIMVEEEEPVDTNNLKSGLTIQSQLRYAIQVATNFSHTGDRNLSFYNVEQIDFEGQPMLSVDIENKGDYLFKPGVTVELFNTEGQSVGVLDAQKKKIYPGTSARFMIDLEGIPPGNYKALIIADCGEEDVFGINMDLSLGKK